MRKNLVLIVLLTLLLLCGCGSYENLKTDVSVAEIFDALEQSGLSEKLDERAELGDELFDEACEALYGVTADELTDGGIMYVSSGKSADEISIISGSADCEKLLNERAKQRESDFEGYAPEESQKATDAEAFECGGLYVLIIADEDSREQIKDEIISIIQ
ncbi:MAG: DUF4358 domain-containing protein [Ruminococcus sp.]|nr:DUF4358 domain-containing protein [Ruminococcus sp.]